MKTVSEDEEHGSDAVVTVVSQQGYCGAGYRVGDQIRFSGVTIEGNLCIHALCGLLPKVLAMRYGAQFPWLEDPDVSLQACPDAQNPVVFELRRIKE